MAALTKDRNTPSRTAELYQDPVAAGARIYAGAMVCLDAQGFAVPASGATGLTARGMALREADNRQGGNGAVAVDVQSGCYGLKSDGSIGRQHIGRTAYFVDDQTVSATADGRSAAGAIKDIEGQGHDAIAWVIVG